MKKSFVLLCALALFVAPYAGAQAVGVFTGQASVGTDGGIGEASFSGGTYEILASGDDIWNSADGMYWVYQEISGNFRMTMTGAWGPQEIPGGDETAGNDWKKFGIMVRDAEAEPGSAYIYAMVRNDLGDTLQTRAEFGTGAASITPLAGKGANDTETLRLTRIGTTYIMERGQTDGSFRPVGSGENVNLPETVYLGIAVTAHDVNNLERAFFTDVSIEQLQGVGASTSRDLGGVATASAGDSIPVTVTLAISGTDSGDVTVTETLPSGWSAAGINASGGTATASGNVITWDVPGASGTMTLTYNATVGATGGSVVFGGGVNNGSDTFSTGGDSALFVFGASDGFGIFDNSMDIQDPNNPANLGAAGSSSYTAASDTYVVVGSGNDIWNTADNFHYLYKQVPMDQPISLKATVKLDPLGGSEQTWAKAGPMIRDDLDAAASHVFSMIRAGGRDFGPQWRPTFGGGGAWDGDPSLVAGGTGAGQQSGTVEIARTPDTNENMYIYYDAATGEKTVSMTRDDIEFLGSLEDDTQYYVGLAVTSHQAGEISVGTFTDVVLKIGDISDVNNWSLY